MSGFALETEIINVNMAPFQRITGYCPHCRMSIDIATAQDQTDWMAAYDEMKAYSKTLEKEINKIYEELHELKNKKPEETTIPGITWKDVAFHYPELVQWIVQKYGPVPEGDIKKKDYKRFKLEWEKEKK